MHIHVIKKQTIICNHISSTHVPFAHGLELKGIQRFIHLSVFLWLQLIKGEMHYSLKFDANEPRHLTFRYCQPIHFADTGEKKKGLPYPFLAVRFCRQVVMYWL